jgi:hypothetical protein
MVSHMTITETDQNAVQKGIFKEKIHVPKIKILKCEIRVKKIFFKEKNKRNISNIIKMY